jgi:hypothetical protein
MDDRTNFFVGWGTLSLINVIRRFKTGHASVVSKLQIDQPTILPVKRSRTTWTVTASCWEFSRTWSWP